MQSSHQPAVNGLWHVERLLIGIAAWPNHEQPLASWFVVVGDIHVVISVGVVGVDY